VNKIIFGIRESRLAKAQLEEFISYLSENGIHIEYDIKTIKTKGDRDTSAPIDHLGQGIFIKELESELLSGKIDCAVHSLKDMPVNVTDKTALACFPPRSDERDCLVCREGVSPDGLKGASIATGSPRRTAFVKEAEADVKILPLRGNVDTRLRKLEQGDFDAMIIASCGLKRIGCSDRISAYLDSDTFVPAAGQGTICAQVRDNDTELLSALQNVSCEETEQAAISERKVLKELGVGCRMPFGVFARFESNEFVIAAKAYLNDRESPYVYCKQKGPREDYEKVTDDIIKELSGLWKK
jgi:hydroxymethylbilane synthase